MKKLVVVSIGLSFLFAACNQKANNTGATSSSAAVTSASVSTAAGSASASASSSAASASLSLAGKYDSVAAPIAHVSASIKGGDSTEGIGAGTLSLTVPSQGGQVAGTASGALGELTISGFAKEGRVTATITPAASASVRFWGTLEGKLEGKSMSGAIHANSGDTRLIREAKFTVSEK